MGRQAREPPVFYPTMADMRGSFEAYIESIEEDLEEFGIGRIVPPAGWKPRQEGYEDIDFTVPQPITQVRFSEPRQRGAKGSNLARVFFGFLVFSPLYKLFFFFQNSGGARDHFFFSSLHR